MVVILLIRTRRGGLSDVMRESEAGVRPRAERVDPIGVWRRRAAPGTKPKATFSGTSHPLLNRYRLAAAQSTLDQQQRHYAVTLWRNRMTALVGADIRC